jgi:hypothetical protein
MTDALLLLSDDELAADPTVQQLVGKLVIYRAWHDAAVCECQRLRVERDALKDELRRYMAMRVPPC